MHASITDDLRRFAASGAPYHLLNLDPRADALRKRELIALAEDALGRPFRHAEEGLPLVAQIKPQPRLRDYPPGHAANFTAARFDLHTEMPYLTHPQSFLLLYGVRNDDGVKTLISGIDAAIEAFDRQDRRYLDELRKPKFFHPVPAHFKRRPRRIPSRPVLTEGRWGMHLRVRFDSTGTACPIGAKALKALHKAMGAVTQGIALMPGQLLVVNNAKAAHGREAFTPTLDANDRELWRIYVAEDVGRYGAAYDPEQRQVSGF